MNINSFLFIIFKLTTLHLLPGSVQKRYNIAYNPLLKQASIGVFVQLTQIDKFKKRVAFKRFLIKLILFLLALPKQTNSATRVNFGLL